MFRKLGAIAFGLTLGLAATTPAAAAGNVPIERSGNTFHQAACPHNQRFGVARCFAHVVTDSAGQYSIVNLRPGTYTVSFTLSGFSVYRRENILLEANFTAQVNAEMRIGELAEEIGGTYESALFTVAVGSAMTRAFDGVHDTDGVERFDSGHAVHHEQF